MFPWEYKLAFVFFPFCALKKATPVGWQASLVFQSYHGFPCTVFAHPRCDSATLLQKDVVGKAPRWASAVGNWSPACCVSLGKPQAQAEGEMQLILRWFWCSGCLLDGFALQIQPDTKYKSLSHPPRRMCPWLQTGTCLKHL